MAGFSNYLEDKVLGHILGKSAYVQPSGLYVALFTSDPTDTGTAGTEVSGKGYARQQVTFANPSNGSASSSADVLFPVATASWGAITHAAVYDAVTSGNMLWSGALTTSKTIDTDDQFKIATGNLTLSLD